MMKIRLLILSALAALLLDAAGAAGLQKKSQDDRQRREESQDHFKKWLEQDVAYIISPQEREIFLKLATPEEKESFIEQFWRRRDTDPATAHNEFKQEHYRRIAYANEHFHSGVAGWKTDRGRIYITFGPPHEISGKPQGGMHVRSPFEGGGSTSVFPFIVWRYRYIEGIGPDVEIEFVDPHQSGEFRLARDAMEKDALLYTPNAGSTLAEAAGLQDKRDRIATRSLANQTLAANDPFRVVRSKDQPFERLLLRARLDRPPAVRFKDLETAVRSRIRYESIAHDVRLHYIWISANDILAPLTLRIPNRELSYRKLESGLQRAEIQLYAEVWDVGKRLVYSFDDELSVEIEGRDFESGLARSSIFQRYLPLRPGRYAVKVAVKDARSAKIGASDHLLVLPRFSTDQLSSSSLILADSISPHPAGREPGMFSLGDVRVIPSVDQAFGPGDNVFVYFQLYGAAIDQQRAQPSLQLSRIVVDGKGRERASGDHRPRMQIGGMGRIVLSDYFPVAGLEAGTHTLQYRVRDRIGGGELELTARFEVRR